MKFKSSLLIMLIVILSVTMIFGGCQKQEKVEETTEESVAENEDKASDKKEENKVLTVGTSASYYPWAFKKDDVVQGFEIDVWNEIAKRNGYTLEFKLAKFSGLVGMLDADKIDTIAHQMSITDERLEKYYFTEPYAYSYYDFAVKNDSEFQKMEDLKGKKVGCWLGGNGERTLRDINEKKSLDLDIVTYDGAPIEKEVEVGRIDASWQGEIKTLSTIKQANIDLRMIGARPFYEVNAYPFLKNDEKKTLVDEVAATIKEMHKDGTLEKLSKKWFELDTTKKPQN